MKRFFFIVFIFVAIILLPLDTFACPNCKSATDNGNSWSNRGLNTGILYLMAVPYIAIAFVAYFWYRHSKKNKEEQKRLASILKDKLE
jgi:hypothetical protein